MTESAESDLIGIIEFIVSNNFQVATQPTPPTHPKP